MQSAQTPGKNLLSTDLRQCIPLFISSDHKLALVVPPKARQSSQPFDLEEFGLELPCTESIVSNKKLVNAVHIPAH